MDRVAKQAENIQRALRDGPRLTTAYNTWIGAVTTDEKWVLICGLGSMGIGKSWYRNDDHHRSYDGYEEAERMDPDPDEMGRLAWIPKHDYQEIQGAWEGSNPGYLEKFELSTEQFEDMKPVVMAACKALGAELWFTGAKMHWHSRDVDRIRQAINVGRAFLGLPMVPSEGMFERLHNIRDGLD